MSSQPDPKGGSKSLEQQIKVLQDWKILKSALKEKYPAFSDAFNGLKKPDAEVLTKSDFADYKSVNIDAIFQEAQTEQLTQTILQKMWEEWEARLEEKMKEAEKSKQSEQPKQSEQTKQQSSSSNQSDQKEKKKTATQENSNLDLLSSKLDNMLTISQKQAKAKEPPKISGDCFQTLIGKKAEPKPAFELQISKFKIIDDGKEEPADQKKEDGAEKKDDAQTEKKDENQKETENKVEPKEEKKDDKPKSMLERPANSTQNANKSPIKKSYIDNNATSYIKKPSPNTQIQRSFIQEQSKASPATFFSSPGNQQNQNYQQFEEEEDPRGRQSTRKSRIKESFEGYLSGLFVNPNPVKYYSPQKQAPQKINIRQNNLNYIKQQFQQRDDPFRQSYGGGGYQNPPQSMILLGSGKQYGNQEVMKRANDLRSKIEISPNQTGQSTISKPSNSAIIKGASFKPGPSTLNLEFLRKEASAIKEQSGDQKTGGETGSKQADPPKSEIIQPSELPKSDPPKSDPPKSDPPKSDPPQPAEPPKAEAPKVEAENPPQP